ncbi:hypothetical protein P3C29_29650 [Pseudomonas sp. 1912-s]|uniref:hypothetical protein n=1 Tax=Pseudomonas sp. 1912-s TaxID=3033802 RepID=UPI0023DF15AD|nr:hypothetical protein [Pseudomonas sp. 1912-s]MDF3202861.1 hypothetical protein [Pseudomonas sp. 1912-s]
MKKTISYIIFLSGWFFSSISIADDLPEDSLLQRYRVAGDQLPTPDPSVAKEVVRSKSHFKIEEEKPFIQFNFKENRPKPTGNLSIDSVNLRDLKECLRMREALSAYGKKHIECNEN